MGLGVCCRLALGRLPLKAYMKKEGGQSVASSHRVNPGMRLRDNPSWSHQVFLSYPAMLAVTAGRGIAMGFPMEISFLCETHWVPSASPRCLLQELEQVLKWGTTGGGSSGPGVTPEGPGKAITGGWIPASLGVWKPFSREVTPHPRPPPPKYLSNSSLEQQWGTKASIFLAGRSVPLSCEHRPQHPHPGGLIPEETGLG